MQCSDFEHHIDDWLDGRLPPEQAQAAARHAEHCPDCAQLAVEYREMLSALGRMAAPEMPAELAERVLETKRDRQPVRAIAVAASLCLAVALALMLGPREGGETGPAAVQQVSLSVAEPREVQLALSTPRELENATLTLQLPDNVELEGHPERRELRWTTSLREGQNRLKLPLIATDQGEGELVLRIEHGDKSRVMRIGVRANGKSLSTDRNGPQPGMHLT